MMVHFESSFTPPLDYQLPDISIQQSDSGALSTNVAENPQGLGPNIWLRIVRPKFTFNLPIIGSQTSAPGGEPIPWYIGLAGLLLFMSILGAYVYHYLFRK